MKMEINTQAKRLAKIIAVYEDGSTKQIDKGALVQMSDALAESSIDINFRFLNLEKGEIVDFVNAVVRLGFDLGIIK